MSLTLGRGMLGRVLGAGAPVFDPSTMPLTGRWKEGDYTDGATGTWTPTASAGTSGTNGNLEQATAAKVPIETGGSPEFVSSDDLGNVNTIDAFLAVTGWMFAGAIEDVDMTDAFAAGASYQNTAIATNDGQGAFYLTATTAGISAGHYDSVTFKEVSGPCNGVGKHWFIAWYDGTDLNMRVGGVDATPVPAGDAFPGFIGGTLVVGRNFDSSKFLVGRTLELMTMDRSPTGPELTDLSSYLAATFP